MGKRKSSSSGGQEMVPKQQTKSYELSTKTSNKDKTTGDYSRYSMTEKVTENQRHVERGSRKEGVRDEYKTTKKVKYGNDSGYTEYQCEETYRNVTYDKNTSGAKKNDGGARYLTDGGGEGNGNGYYYCGVVEYYKG